jgi:hypothetical protein
MNALITPFAKKLAEARETIRRLNRRCQEADGAMAAKLDSPLVEGRTFGRACANYAASMYKRERDEARAALRFARTQISDGTDAASIIDDALAIANRQGFTGGDPV